MTDATASETLDLREKLAHIDRMLADIDQKFADRDHKRQEIRLAPWQMAISGMTAGAAIFAAGAAVMKLLTPG